MAAVKRMEAEWREMIGAQKASGLKQRAWCAANGVNYQTFVKRVSVLRIKGAADRESAGPRKFGWVEMAPARAAVLDAGGDGAAGGKLQVAVGAYKVIIPGVFEEAALKRVCKALSEIC